MFSIQENNSKKVLMALGFLFSFVELVSVPMTPYEEAMAMQLMQQMGIDPVAQPGDVAAPGVTTAPSQPDFSSQIQNLENDLQRLRTENLTLQTNLVNAKKDLATAGRGPGFGSRLLGAAASAAVGAVVGAGGASVLGGAGRSEGGGAGAGGQQVTIDRLNVEINTLRDANHELTEENNRLQGQINILNAQGDNLGATGNLRASSGNVAADASGVRIARLEAQLQELVDLIPVGMRVADAGGRVDLIASIRSILNQLRIVTDRNVFLNMRADALEAQLNAVREALRNFQEALPEGLRLNNIDKNLLDVLWLTLARFESLWRRAVAERELRNVSRRRSSFSSSRSEIREL